MPYFIGLTANLIVLQEGSDDDIYRTYIDGAFIEDVRFLQFEAG